MITIAEVKKENTNAKRNCVSNPIHESRFQKLEKALNDLFLRELNSPKSIFIKISPNVVRKAAMFLSGMSFRPAAIGICGETASGKSTIVLDAIEIVENFTREFLNANAITRINTDDYYHNRSVEVIKAGSFAEFAKTYDFDVPEAIELSLMKEHVQKLLKRKEVFLPKYDMSGTAMRYDNHTRAIPSPVIIAEGLYALNEKVCDIFDFKIYVDIEKSVQKERFFERAKQRNLGDSAHKIFENASKKAQIYVHPCAENADIILNGEVPRENFRKFVISLLKTVESTYYNFAV